ncbi:MAG: hypothetical protein FAF05_01845 [Epsilonproteobacteria bacterium]|nr:hypothetical protein [Campylobacterota bacterium]
MKTYYYAHTGHRIGLDRFRRAAAILECIDVDITLLCSDFRIAQEARNFGIDKAVGIDVVRNIANIAQKGDKLILDSDEVNPVMLEDMRNYFSSLHLIRADEVVVADKYFEPCEKTVKLSYFFGDDDYEKDLEKHLDFIEDLNPHLQLGYYYFLDYEDMLKERFTDYFEFEEYDEMIMRSEVLITASPQAVLESLASGGKPIYIQREDCIHHFAQKFQQMGVPIVKNYDKNVLNSTLHHINEIKYAKIAPNCQKASFFIKKA